MARVSAVAFLVLNGLLLTGAIPQYGPQGGSSSGASYASAGGAPPAAAAAPPPPPPPPAPVAPAAPAYGGSSGGGSAPGGGAPAPGGSPAGGSSGGNNQLTVQCKATPDAGGKFKYDCSGVNKDAITLKTEHFLWLENQAGSSQNLDVEIPNYNIDEFIKAAYKTLGPQDGAKINILLKKPDVTYNAQKDDAPKADVGAPSVSVNYQPVDKISVHYPTQKQYSTGGGSSGSSSAASSSSDGSSAAASAGGAPAAAGGAPAGGNYGGGAPAAAPAGPSVPAGGSYGGAAGGAGAYSRPQRESGFRYYFIRQ